MPGTFIRYPSSAASAIPTYATFAALPGSADDGSAAITLDTDSLYIYNAGTLTWRLVASPDMVLSVGTFDSETASADGAVIDGGAIIFQSASETEPGMVNTGVQTFAGNKTFSGTIEASNLSGVNTGDVGLGAVGSSPNANGASLSGQTLTLQPADATNPGVLSAGAQTIGGDKTFSGAISASNLSGTNTGDQTITLTGDVTGSGTGSFAATIAANAVSNAKMAQMAAATIKGNDGGGAADPQDLSVAEVHAMLGTQANPLTTLGDIIYGGASGVQTRLAGDTSDTRKFLRGLSVAGTATAPVWDTLVAGDIPSLAASKITSGALATARGGTNLDTSGSTGVPSISSGTWSVAAALASSLGGVPTGAVIPFAGTSEPTGWLLCYGQAVSRATYSALYTALGDAYGAGNGTTTFNLPDLRGRTAVGKDDMGGAAAGRMTSGGSGVDGATLGASGGTQTHALTSGELATHTHTASVTDAGHTHGFLMDAGNDGNALFSDSNYLARRDSAGANYARAASANTNSVVNASATTGVTVANSNTGSGTAHQNTQPSQIFNYIIKT